MDSKIFLFNPETSTTFIDQQKDVRWPSWKKYGDLSDEEKKVINLAQYPKDCLLLDRDFKNNTQEEIEETYIDFMKKIKSKGVLNYLSWRSPNGFHVLIKFKDLDKLSDEVKTEIKRIYVNEFDCDVAKISDRGVVSLPDKPHFKNGVSYPVREEFYESSTPIPTGVMSIALSKAIEREDINKAQKVEIDMDFKDFFTEDPFWSFLEANQIPEGTNRDLTLFPNLAIAAVKSGKNKKEIDELIRPVIENNFPGKSYAEFEGWLRKAFSGEISEFNPFLINKWFKEYFSIGKLYDLEPISIDETLSKLNKEDKEDETKVEERLNLIWNEDILNITEGSIEWLVEGWIGKGDICIYGGKSNAYKTTSLMHMGLCIANGLPVFNKYKVKQSKVLYINEENHRQLTKDIFKRCYNGLDLTSSKDFALIQEEGLKLDADKEGKTSDLFALAQKIIDNKIEVVILDTLRRFISFDENDATKMSMFYDRIKKLRKYCGYPTIIILHHSKKSPQKGSYDVRDELRGSSDIVQSADTVIALERTVGKSCFKISQVKSRGSIEQGKKLIMVDGKDDPDNISYLYESEKADFAVPLVNKIEETAEDIMVFVENSKRVSFARKEIYDALKEKHSDVAVFKALKELEQDGTVIKQGTGKNCVWVFANTNMEVSA